MRITLFDSLPAIFDQIIPDWDKTTWLTIGALLGCGFILLAVWFIKPPEGGLPEEYKPQKADADAPASSDKS